MPGAKFNERRRLVRATSQLALGLALTTSPALAQDAGVLDAGARDGGADASARAEADARFRAAMAAFLRGEYAGAAEGFRAAYELVPHPFPLYNMGRAYEGGGEIARAMAAYERYLAESPDAPDAAEVRRRLDALRQRPVEVFLASDPSGASVRVDADERAPAVATPAVLHLVPGPHVLVFEHDGRRPLIRRVELLAGVSSTVNAELEALAAPPPPPPPPPTPPEPSNYDRVLRRRTHRLFSARASLLGGFAWPRDKLNFALGVDATVFLGRSLAAQVHFLRLEADGTPLVLVGELGWVFAIDDLDLGAFLNLGTLLSCEVSCRDATTDPESVQLIGGVTLRADLMLLPHVGIGLFGRFHWRNLNIGSTEALLSSLGLSISIHL